MKNCKNFHTVCLIENKSFFFSIVNYFERQTGPHLFFQDFVNEAFLEPILEKRKKYALLIFEPNKTYLGIIIELKRD